MTQASRQTCEAKCIKNTRQIGISGYGRAKSISKTTHVNASQQIEQTKVLKQCEKLLTIAKQVIPINTQETVKGVVNGGKCSPQQPCLEAIETAGKWSQWSAETGKQAAVMM